MFILFLPVHWVPYMLMGSYQLPFFIVYNMFLCFFALVQERGFKHYSNDFQRSDLLLKYIMQNTLLSLEHKLLWITY